MNHIRTLAAILIAIAIPLAAAGAALADPAPKAFENWKTDFAVHSVPLSDIRSGGPPKDGIPAIDEPLFVPIGEDTVLTDRDPVMALEINGDARAYPLYVLMWHEIANDVVGGKPVAVTFCPLCNSTIVFDAELGGKTLDFGTTGRLRNSDLVMYDRQTETWWQQFSGEAIIGEMTGEKLRKVPSTVMPFGQFKKRYPDARVLVPNNPETRRYGANPYRHYDTADRPFLYAGAMPEGIEPMERVVVIEHGNQPIIATINAIRSSGSMERDGLTITWQEGMASALDNGVISQGRDVGFVEVSDKDGKPIVHDVTFAFVAHAFHPEIEIEGKGETVN